MRLLSLVITVLIIGFILYKQIGSESVDSGSDLDGTNLDLPKVPTKPNEVQAFEKDINNFVNEASKEAAKKIEEAEK